MHKNIMKSLLIFYREVQLEEGFALTELHKDSRILAGREVSLPSGINLFVSLKDAEINCWQCGCTADRWISCHGPKEKSRPVLNLFAIRENKLVMMTRDHIIPKSLGGMDLVKNLRPGCEVCNHERSSNMDLFDHQFMIDHPELISPERVARGLENKLKYSEHLKLNTCA
jgi:hypothetical protein